jgi:hypothetical protein
VNQNATQIIPAAITEPAGESGAQLDQRTTWPYAVRFLML